MKSRFKLFASVITALLAFSQGHGQGQIINDTLEIHGDSEKAKIIIEPNNTTNTIHITARKNNTASNQPGRSIRWYTKQNQELSMTLSSLGNLGLGTLSPNARFTVQDGNLTALFGADTNSETLTDNTRKFARIGAPHYVNTEEPMAGMVFDSNANSNIVWLGGGTNQFNSATELRFVAANSNVNQGSNNPTNVKMILKSSGNVGIGNSNPTSLLHLSSLSPVLTIENSGAGNEDQHEIYFRESDEVGMKINYNGSISAVLDRIEFVDRTGGTDNIRAVIQRNGDFGIGTTSPDSKLEVNGTIRSSEVVVAENTGADYVFEKDYELASLNTISEFIKENKHLPEVPTALQMQKDGLKLGEMNILLLKKIEELTLHLIQEHESNKELRERISVLEAKLAN